MFLQKITLTNFKSYEFDTFEFSERVNCIVGENGSGKTNLLDAIYFLALTKSAFSNQDALSIHHEADFMMIDGVFQTGGVEKSREVEELEVEKKKKNKTQTTKSLSLNPQPLALKSEQITCSLQRGQRKAVLCDKKAYEKIGEHIGKYPVVLIAPNDTDIIRDGSEERRKFFDGVLSQLDAEYLENLLQYNRLLLQRNSLLKQFAERNHVDIELLDIYSNPLVEVSLKLFERRKDFIEQYVPIFQEQYEYLSESREKVEVIYETEMADGTFEVEFKRNQSRDLAAQRTTKGAHKDDFVFEINGFALRKFGSQGQQKSFLIALKLAQFQLLAQEKKTSPLLLLDDVFDKLDDRRIEKLLQRVQNQDFGQLFITDARPERTKSLLDGLGLVAKYFEIGGR